MELSKRSKACDIPLKVREEVYERDNHQCIFCGKWVPIGNANAHFVKRSQGGLGVPENTFTACIECHYEEDFGKNTKEYEQVAESYLKGIYGTNWDKSKLVYKK